MLQTVDKGGPDHDLPAVFHMYPSGITHIPLHHIPQEMVVLGQKPPLLIRQELFRQGSHALLHKIPIGGICPVRDHSIGQLRLPESRQHMEQDPHSQETAGDFIPVPVQDLQKLSESCLALPGVEYPIIDPHGLGALAVALHQHPVQVQVSAPQGIPDLHAKFPGKGTVKPKPHCLEHLLRLPAHPVHHHTVRKAQGYLVGLYIPVHRHPVPQTKGNDALPIPSFADIFQITQHGVGILPDHLCLPPVFVYHIGQFEQRPVPGRTISPVIAPAPCGHDPWQTAVLPLGQADIVQPFPPAFLCPHGQNHMLCGNLGIPCPAVLLPVGAVHGKIKEIGLVASCCHGIDGIGRLIGAVEASPLLQGRR